LGLILSKAKDFLIKEVGPLTVGMMIRNHRNRLGLSQAELANIINVTVGYISNVETGRKKLSLEKTLYIAKKIKANHKHFALIWFEEESRANGISFKEIAKLEVA